jgi:hypothetical protein
VNVKLRFYSNNFTLLLLLLSFLNYHLKKHNATDRVRQNEVNIFFLPLHADFLLGLVFNPARRKWNITPQYRLTFNILHSIISQKTGRSIILLFQFQHNQIANKFAAFIRPEILLPTPTLYVLYSEPAKSSSHPHIIYYILYVKVSKEPCYWHHMWTW